MKKLRMLLAFVTTIFLITAGTPIFSQVPVKSIPIDTAALNFPDPVTGATSQLTYKIIEAPNNTFGYDVFSNERLMIHQSSVPGLPGNEGFKTKADAEKVAGLVMEKIKKGEMPPTITTDELKALKVIQ